MVAAYGPAGLGRFLAAPAPPGSVEFALRATGRADFVLDVRAAARAADGTWLREQHDFRAIGALAEERGFWPSAVASEFDAVVYVDRTTATTPLPRTVTPPAR